MRACHTALSLSNNLVVVAEEERSRAADHAAALHGGDFVVQLVEQTVGWVVVAVVVFIESRKKVHKENISGALL
jgi:hypothetical protein